MARSARAVVLAVVAVGASTNIVDQRLVALQAKVEEAGLLHTHNESAATLPKRKLEQADHPKVLSAKADARVKAADDGTVVPLSDEFWTSNGDGLVNDEGSGVEDVAKVEQESKAEEVVVTEEDEEKKKTAVSTEATELNKKQHQNEALSPKPIKDFQSLQRAFEELDPPTPSLHAEEEGQNDCSGSNVPKHDTCFSGDMHLGTIAGQDAGSMQFKIRYNNEHKIHVSAVGTINGRDISVKNLAKDISSWWQDTNVLDAKAASQNRLFEYGYCADQKALMVSTRAGSYMHRVLLSSSNDCPA